jgi:hypothetical protein
MRVGGGQQVYVARTGVRSCAAYVSKYLAKQLGMKMPRYCRRITTSRNIKLIPKIAGPNPFEWRFEKQSVWQHADAQIAAVRHPTAYGFHTVSVLDCRPDSEGFLESFAIESVPVREPVIANKLPDETVQ